MPGSEETIRLFDIPANKADLAEMLAMVKQLDEQSKNVQGISIFGKAGNAAEARQQQASMAAGMQQITELQQKMIELEKQLSAAKEKTSGGGKAKTDEETRAYIEAAEARKQNIASIKDQIKWDQAEVDSMVRKRIELKQIKAEYIKLGPEKQAMESGQAMITQMKALSDELLRLESSYGQNGRNVGNYSKALKTLEEEFKKVTSAMEAMETKSKTAVQNLGAAKPMGFDAGRWSQNNTTALSGPGGVPVSVLNEDAEAYAKLSQQAGYLNTIIQKNEVGFSSVTQQIRTNEKALQSLRAAGLEGSEAFAQLREETIESAREMKEFQRQQKLLESELPALKALTLAAKGLGGAYAIGAGASALFAEGNEKVEKELNKLVAIMTLLQGIEEAWQLVQQAGAARMAFKATATEVATAATAAYTFVTEAATGATMALNAALVASGIGAIIVALGGMIYLLSKAKVNVTELYEAQAKLNEQMKDYYEALVKSNEALGDELKKQDEIGKKQEEIQAINVRSISDQLALNKLKHDNAENDKKRAAAELADLKKRLGNNEDIRGEYDEQLRRIGRLRDLSAQYAADIADRKSKGEGTDVQEAQLKNNEALTKTFETQAGALKIKLDRFTDLTNQEEEAEQWIKHLNAEDQKFAHELYEHKIKAITELANIMRDRSADFLRLQQSPIIGSEATRQTAADAELALRQQIIIANRDLELRNKMLTNKEVEVIEEKAQNELYALDVEFIGRRAQINYDARQQEINDNNFTNEELLKQQEKFYQREEQLAQTFFANRKAAEETDRDQRLRALSELHTKRNPAEENVAELQKYNDQKLAIETAANNKILEAEKELTRRQIAIAQQKEEDIKRFSPDTAEGKQKQLKDIQDLEQQKNSLTAKYANLDLQIEQNNAKQSIALAKEKLAHKRELADAEIELAKQVEDTVSAFIKGSFEAQMNNIQRQVDANNRLKEAETARISNSTLGETEKAAAMQRIALETEARNEALARKQRELRIKEATFDRDASVLKVIQETAIAVATDIKSPWKIPFDIAMGALQVATILAHPIPKFETGTDFSPEGMALVHPGEMRIDPSGRISMTPDTPSLTYLDRGTKIIPKNRQDQMNDILLASLLAGTGVAPHDDRLYDEVRGMKEAIVQSGRDQVAAIKKQKAAPININIESNFLAYIKNNV